MPLLNKSKKEIFTDIGYASNDGIDEEKQPEVSNLKLPKSKKIDHHPQDINKVSCTFHLTAKLRDDLQSLSFVTRTPQNKIVEQAVHTFIKKQGLKLPQRAA